MYLCDGEVETCTKTGFYKNGWDCRHTSNIDHALNPANKRKFIVSKFGDLWEIDDKQVDVLDHIPNVIMEWYHNHNGERIYTVIGIGMPMTKQEISEMIKQSVKAALEEFEAEKKKRAEIDRDTLYANNEPTEGLEEDGEQTNQNHAAARD